MRQKRRTEIEDLKNILGPNLKLLQNEDKTKLLLPQGERKDDQSEEADDILVEDTKDVGNSNLLNKKEKKKKQKEKKKLKKDFISKHVIYVNKN